GRILALGAAQHLDAHDSACARIIGDVQVGLHLNHTEPRFTLGIAAVAAFAFRLRIHSPAAALAGRLFFPNDRPALQLGNRPMLFDPDHVTNDAGILLVVGVVLLAAADGLLEHRMSEPALDTHHHSFLLG